MHSKALSIKEAESAQDAIFIDVRNRGYFLIDHIKGAINIESAKRIAFIAQENADKKLILYCHSGVSAREIADDLKEYKNIFFINASFGAIAKSNLKIEYYSKD